MDVAEAIIYLPGTKTAGSRRVVALTSRGLDAYKRIPRRLDSLLVFPAIRNGGRVAHPWFYGDVWQPAVRLAGFEARPRYSTRHTFAYFSLRAGVPIADLAVEMGHANAAITTETYGHWSREMGTRAASLREAWADSEARGTNTAPAEA